MKPPNPAWRAELIAIAEAGGIHDVVPQLRTPPPTHPAHAQHQLPAPPALPALPSVEGSGEALHALLRRATGAAEDPIGARTALMAAWRLTRHPRLADAIDGWDKVPGGRDRLHAKRSVPGPARS